MTVSKFDPFYIVKSIVMIFFPLLIIFYSFFAEYDSFYFTQDRVLYFLLFFVLLVSVNYLFWHKLIQVTVTENDITFKNLITRRIRQIKLDEIEGISYESETFGTKFYPIATGMGRVQWSDTRRKYIGIKTVNGKVFWFNDSKYANFEEIDKAIVENFDKKSA